MESVLQPPTPTLHAQNPRPLGRSRKHGPQWCIRSHPVQTRSCVTLGGLLASLRLTFPTSDRRDAFPRPPRGPSESKLRTPRTRPGTEETPNVGPHLPQAHLAVSPASPPRGLAASPSGWTGAQLAAPLVPAGTGEAPIQAAGLGWGGCGGQPQGRFSDSPPGVAPTCPPGPPEELGCHPWGKPAPGPGPGRELLPNSRSCSRRY